VAVQTLPPLYEAYVREQRRLTRDAVAEVRRLWRKMDDDFDRSWQSVGPAVLTVTDATQRRLAQNAGAATVEVLEQAPAGRVAPGSLVGVAGDGRTSAGLMFGAVTKAKVSVSAGLTERQALLSGLAWLTMATTTLLADTIRAGETIGMATVAQPSGTVSYVRVVQPGACSRCAILAGATYKSQDAFERHPGCLCTHMPVHGMDYSEIADRGYMVSPEDYFESLSEAEQNRIFTNAGAEAIRNGADPRQVVNARRGMLRAQSGRIKRDARGLYTTVEGTTRRGLYGRRASAVRLMPESIVEMAGGNTYRMQELLRQYGYII